MAEVDFNDLDWHGQISICRKKVVAKIYEKMTQPQPDYRGIRELRILLEELNAVPIS